MFKLFTLSPKFGENLLMVLSAIFILLKFNEYSNTHCFKNIYENADLQNVFYYTSYLFCY